MGLRNYKPDLMTVKASSETEFQVRSISLDPLTVILRDNLADLEKMLTLYGEAQDSNIAASQMAVYALGIVRDAPQLAAAIIAHATVGEREPVESEEEAIAALTESASKLGMTVQIDALRKIGELTFREAGGAKKFFEGLMLNADAAKQAVSMIPSGT